MIIPGGYAHYGQDIGILMLDTRFPRMIGDIGNAKTFPFPVRYKVVRQASPERVVLEQDGALLESFIAGARELEAEGVKAITTSCGFLAVFQEQLAAAVSIPVFTSCLFVVPMVERMIGKDRKVVIITAHKGKLTERHLTVAAIAPDRTEIIGLESKPEFYSVFIEQKQSLDLKKLRDEMAETADEVRYRFPHAGAIVFECTNLPPFRALFHEITGLPVFDIIGFIQLVQSGFLPAI